MNFFKGTTQWKDYWQKRKIDWSKSYQNWDHPHRFAISAILRNFEWMSLFEIGVGGGANLMNIVKHFKDVQLGGLDVSKDAIDLSRKTFTGAHFKVGSVEDIMLSDDSVDVVLSDMTLIYLDPTRIDAAIKEMVRVGRKAIVLCEFHSPSLLKRLQLRYNSGYYAYDYKKLLEKHGCYDIEMYKLPEELWPGGNPQKTYAFLIKAKLLK